MSNALVEQLHLKLDRWRLSFSTLPSPTQDHEFLSVCACECASYDLATRGIHISDLCRIIDCPPIALHCLYSQRPFFGTTLYLNVGLLEGDDLKVGALKAAILDPIITVILAVFKHNSK